MDKINTTQLTKRTITLKFFNFKETDEMMTIKVNLRQLLPALAVALCLKTDAQLVLDFNQSATQMAQSLAGPGVQISNAVITGADSSYAYYYATGTEIGTSNGVLLTTGRAIYAIGPNNWFGTCNSTFNPPFPLCSYFDRDTPGSELLEESQVGCLPSQEVCTNDACQLEFDIVPQGYNLTFNYTFASEEYLEWVNSPFNDVFGFYISGPGITGNQNIALVPGTGEFVAINTVNHLENSQYFQLNSNPIGQYIQYDGFTLNLQAYIDGLTPCETYHLTLVIADARDATYDSGVFIEAIQSDPVVIVTTTSNGLDYMVEGCNTGIITFAREEANAFPQDVTYYIGGTATDGVDYEPQLGDGQAGTPLTITIPAYEDEVSISIDAIADVIPEGLEYITIYLDNPACQGNEILDSVNFYIYDVLDLAIIPEDTTVCAGNCVELTGITIFGELGSFEWSGGSVSLPDSLVVEVCPEQTTTYMLTATVGACTATDEVTVHISSISVDLDASDSQCFTNGTGSIAVTVNDAVPPYAYSWTGPDGFTSTEANINGLLAGEYCVQVTDSVGCLAEACAFINQSNEMTVSGALSDFNCHAISCYNVCDGSIDLTVTGGTGPYSYSWTGPGEFTNTSSSINGLCSGTYEVIVTDSLGCEVTQTYLLQQPDSLVINIIGTVDLLCTGVETGQAIVDADGGCGPYTYSWSHDENETGPVAANLASGIYNVSVSDVNGCTNDGSVTIVINDPIDPLTVILDSLSLYPGGTNTSCPGSEDGFVELVVSGGSLPYTFSWYSEEEEAIISTEEDLMNVSCGDYSVTITDNNGCVFEESYTLTCLPAITATYVSTPNPCGAPEAGIGAIQITALGGGHGEPYTWTWSGPSCPCPSDSTISNLNSGDYQLSISDSFGCNTVVNINVGQNDVFTATANVTNLSCYQSCDGLIDVEVVPEGNYTYTWTGPNGYTNSGEDAIDICAGSYSVTISANDCFETFNFNVSQPVEIEIDGILTQPICFGQNNGSIDITVTNGSGEYTYQWVGGCFPPLNENTEDIFNLFQCTYTVTVTDVVSNCVVSESFELDAPEVMELVVTVSEFEGGYNVSCGANNDGWINVDVVGGTPDCNAYSPECYFFDWLGANCASVDPAAYGNDPNASSIGGLPAGAYGVNVTDINGCLATTCIDLLEPDTIASNPIISNIVCADPAGGNINPGITGGTPPYQYSWSGPVGPGQQDDAVLIGIPAGTYSLTVTDVNECQKVFEYEITETVPVEIINVNQTNCSCSNVADGTVSFDIDPLSANIESITVDGENINFGSGTILIEGLDASEHVIEVTDENGCVTTLNVNIGSPAPLIVSLTSVTLLEGQLYDLQCFGDEDGQLIATVSGGTPEYTLEWTDENDIVLGSDTTIFGLTPGEYCVDVTDSNGCVGSECYEITQPDSPILVVDSVSIYNEVYNVTCFDASDGSIDLTVSGGVPGYTFDWAGVNTIDGQEDQTGLSAGSYAVLILDNNYCDITLLFELVEPEQLNIVLDETIQPACDNTCDGEIAITVIGGVTPYDFQWNGANGYSSTNEDLEDLCEDTYTFTVIDDVGCTADLSIDISNPNPVVATTVSDYNCATGNYDVCVVASGGTNNFTYQWSTGENTQCISIDEDGEVCVTVSDANGCQVELCETYDVGSVLTVEGDVTNTTCGQCNGEIDITISGGVGDYTIVWTGNGTVQGQEDQQNLCPGVYIVTVTDENACPSTAEFTIGEDDNIDVSFESSNISCFGAGDGSASVSVAGATNPVTYTWLDDNNTILGTGDNINGLQPGDYQLQWEDNGGCEGVVTFTITEPLALTLDYSVTEYGDYNISTVNGNDGCIYLDVEGGTPAYVYQWQPQQADNDTICNLSAGTYCVTITDANNCSLDTCITLVQPEELKLPTGLSPNGDGFNDTYYIPGAYLCKGSIFKVFNRWGNKVYEKSNYDNDWYGQTSDGGVLADGTYFVIFEGCEKEFNTYVDLRRE